MRHISTDFHVKHTLIRTSIRILCLRKISIFVHYTNYTLKQIFSDFVCNFS